MDPAIEGSRRQPIANQSPWRSCGRYCYRVLVVDDLTTHQIRLDQIYAGAFTCVQSLLQVLDGCAKEIEFERYVGHFHREPLMICFVEMIRRALGDARDCNVRQCFVVKSTCVPS